MTGTKKSAPKLLFVVTEDWAFLRHRLPMAQAAKAAGFEVAVATQVGPAAKDIEALDIKVYPIPINRTGLSPLADLRYLCRLWGIYRNFNPDLVHHVSAKPVLFGTIAARLANVPAILNAFTGMGILFVTKNGKPNKNGLGLKARVLLTALRWAARPSHIHFLVQNLDDRAFILEALCPDPARTSLIPGSGVDTEEFQPKAEPAEGPVTATLVGRLLWTKGVREFVEAARLLNKSNTSLRMVLVGAPDVNNPTSVSVSDLDAWVAEGLIEWHGELDDIANVWENSHIAVLPSYREGLPKSLLEAAACGRPLIATDVPGCRELVTNEKTGLLCPPGNATALAEAIERLMNSPEDRLRFGAAARKDVEQRLSAQVIGTRVTGLYRQLLPTKSRDHGDEVSAQ